MSRFSKIDIECPYCHKVNEFTKWDSVNQQLDPEAVERIMDDSIFEFKCPECKKATLIMHNMLYHDMKKRIMIQLMPNYHKAPEMASILSSAMKSSVSSIDIKDTNVNYITRMVSDPSVLREKIAIFDCGFDDRVIEVMKFIGLTVFIDDEKFKDIVVDSIFFVPRPDPDDDYMFKYSFAYFSKGNIVTSLDFTADDYNECVDDYGDYILNNPAKNDYYDMNWAIQLVKNTHLKDEG